MIRRVAIATATVVVVMAAPAFAAWSVSGTSAQTSNGHTGVLNAPTITSISCTNGTGQSSSKVHVDIIWTAPTTGLTPASYTVTQDGTAIATGATSPYTTGLFTPTHSHTYSYTVVSVTGSWSKASAAHTVAISSNGNCGTVN